MNGCNRTPWCHVEVVDSGQGLLMCGRHYVGGITWDVLRFRAGEEWSLAALLQRNGGQAGGPEWGRSPG